MRLVEKHQISRNHKLYKICDELTLKSKNLYNAALYEIRQSIFEREKAKKENPDNPNLPKIKTFIEIDAKAGRYEGFAF